MTVAQTQQAKDYRYTAGAHQHFTFTWPPVNVNTNEPTHISIITQSLAHVS